MLIPCPESFIISCLAYQHKQVLACLEYLEQIHNEEVKLECGYVQVERDADTKFRVINKILEEDNKNPIFVKSKGTIFNHIDQDFDIMDSDFIVYAQSSVKKPKIKDRKKPLGATTDKKPDSGKLGGIK